MANTIQKLCRINLNVGIVYKQNRAFRWILFDTKHTLCKAMMQSEGQLRWELVLTRKRKTKENKQREKKNSAFIIECSDSRLNLSIFKSQYVRP